MHDTAFDHLTRAMGAGSSRRGLMRALAGGGLTLGLLGWTAGHDVAAKSCKKIKDKKKRRACRKKAQGATGQLPAPPPPPVACPSGTFALAGRCAPTCGQPCQDRGGVCATTFEDLLFCAPNLTSCASIPTVCGSHADCGSREFCTPVLCGPNQSVQNRCAPFLN
jgi:hypothetical protein